MFRYEDLLKEVETFCRYGAETGVVGESELGERIPYVFVGRKNGYRMIVQASIHAREHLTALVAVCLAKHLLKHPELPIEGGIYFVPMTNPDGVRLCQEGVGFITDKQRKSNLLAINGGSDFTLWKANGEGVQNAYYKSSGNYVGREPFSAAETRALRDFTLRLKPVVTLSYHLKGEEVYWEFGQKGHRRLRDKRYAEAISKYTGYPLVTLNGSVGGYKDWCIERLHIPAYTIEVGNDGFDHPFPYGELSAIVRQNLDLPRRLLNTVVRDRKRLRGTGLDALYE